MILIIYNFNLITFSFNILYTYNVYINILYVYKILQELIVQNNSIINNINKDKKFTYKFEASLPLAIIPIILFIASSFKESFELSNIIFKSSFLKKKKKIYLKSKLQNLTETHCIIFFFIMYLELNGRILSVPNTI